MAESFDAIVIGAGEAGTVVANLAVAAGHRVALIYKHPYGSTCLNFGCVPSKLLIHRARVAYLARTSKQFHVHTNEPYVDLMSIVRDKNAEILKHRSESLENAQAADGLTLFEGEARFASKREVLAGGKQLRSGKIFIASGMRPVIPNIEGLDTIKALTNETVMDLVEVPTHLIVVGGSYIGCELGQVFHRFGSRVTILDMRDRLVPEEESDISTLLEHALVEQGIAVLTHHSAVRVERATDGLLVFAKSRDGAQQTIRGTHLLLATGRQPNTDTLRLDIAGVETDETGAIRVNEHLETSVPGIWAIGDVNGKQPFTRVCQEEGKVAYANAFENAGIRMERLYLGHAVFTDPEIGSVGLTERAARDQGYSVAAGLVTFDQVSKARIIGETTGLIKYVVDRGTHRLLGCHVIGPAAADLIYTAILVMRHGGTVDEIAKAVGIFPTLQEGMEGTARGLLRKIAPEEINGPLVAGSIHQSMPFGVAPVAGTERR